jgi:hypothetical protein
MKGPSSNRRPFRFLGRFSTLADRGVGGPLSVVSCPRPLSLGRVGVVGGGWRRMMVGTLPCAVERFPRTQLHPPRSTRPRIVSTANRQPRTANRQTSKSSPPLPLQRADRRDEGSRRFAARSASVDRPVVRGRHPSQWTSAEAWAARRCCSRPPFSAWVSAEWTPAESHDRVARVRARSARTQRGCDRRPARSGASRTPRHGLHFVHGGPKRTAQRGDGRPPALVELDGVKPWLMTQRV